MSSKETWRQWVQTQQSYTPDLESSKAIGDALKDFENALLSDVTAVWSVRGTPNETKIHSGELDLAQLAEVLHESSPSPDIFRFFFIGRFLTSNGTNQEPSPSQKLCVSAEALRLLAKYSYMTPSFLFALSRYYLPNGHSFRRYEAERGEILWSQWYFLPVRVQVPCSDPQQSHETSSTGRNQMNPIHYLHLPDEKVDIRGTQIAIYLFHDGRNGSTNVASFNFMHGHYRKVVEEPRNRILEALQHPNVPSDPMFIHLVFLTTIVRLWINALHAFNEQLIKYEKSLQDNPGGGTDNNGFYSRLSKSLHAMASHAQRYEAELNSLERTASEIGRAFATIYGDDSPSLASIDHVKGQLLSTNALVQELDKKTQNILALLFHRMQINNDQLMVSNGKAMHAIMKATQEEAGFSREIAERSQQLSEAMKKDSISMKTIALLTMFFLPGTSFAALLAMPFFSTNTYLTNGHQMWIWAALTVPSTGFAYAFYRYRRMVEERRDSTKDEDVEMNNLRSQENAQRTATGDDE